MLTGKVFTDNQVSYSVWSREAEGEQNSASQEASHEAHSLTRTNLRRLRRMQTQNIFQRAAFEVVNLFRGHSEVA